MGRVRKTYSKLTLFQQNLNCFKMQFRQMDDTKSSREIDEEIGVFLRLLNNHVEKLPVKFKDLNQEKTVHNNR